MTVTIEGDNAVLIEPDKENNLFVQINIRSLMDCVSTFDFQPDGADSYIISDEPENPNNDLLYLLYDRIRDSMFFGKDENGDGMITGNEIVN